MPPASRRKPRPAPGPAPGPAGSAAQSAAAAGRRLRGAERDALLRARLTPLAPGERPAALVIASVVAAVLAAAVLVGGLTVHDLRRHGGSLPGALLLSGVLGSLAVGMARRRHWAVLGFEALLAFQAVAATIALVLASTLVAALACVVSIALAGWLFWKLVRVMARLQVPPPEDPPPG